MTIGSVMLMHPVVSQGRGVEVYQKVVPVQVMELNDDDWAHITASRARHLFQSARRYHTADLSPQHVVIEFAQGVASHWGQGFQLDDRLQHWCPVTNAAHFAVFHRWRYQTPDLDIPGSDDASYRKALLQGMLLEDMEPDNTEVLVPRLYFAQP